MTTPHPAVIEDASAAVLVIGAGPVGLTAALMLARHGVPVRIIDRSQGPTDLSKALVVWQRTMETLNPALPHQRFSKDHPVLQSAHIHLGGRTVDVAFPSHGDGVPACVMVPQSDTERILIARLGELGITVERRTELTGFDSDDGGVSCELNGPGGAAQLRTPWLVACDGAHSIARRQLNLPFPGHTVNRRWLLADFDVLADQQSGRTNLEIYLTKGIAALFPIGAGRWRLIADLGPGGVEGQLRTLTLAEVQAVLDTRTDLGWRVARLHWTSEFGVNERQVEQYVHGRVLLGGDAAHVHSPAGGQGMNTGMQDAANLAWKIGLVQRGAADPSLLTTYHAERHPVGAAVVRQSGLLLKSAMATGPLLFARDHLAPIALSIPELQRLAVTFLTEESINYRHGPLADGTGYRHGVHSGEVWPLSQGAQAELILLGTAADDEAPETFGTPDGFPLTVTRARVNSRLAEALGQENGAVLVRPDGIVASVGKDATTVLAWITQYVRPRGEAFEMPA